MIWLQFLISSAVVVFAAVKLAGFGDVIAVRSRLSGLFVGTVLLAGATSLPELVASISAFEAGLPDLAAGNFFGSNMVNMVLLAAIDLVHFQVPLLRRVAVTHALTAVLVNLLMLVAILAILAELDITIGWVGVDSLLLIALYFAGVWVVQRENNLQSGAAGTAVSVAGPDFPSLRYGLVGFGASALLLVFTVPFLVDASSEIAVVTGLGATFVGTALLSVVTSLPELVAAIGAMRIGAYDMAVGNLFGSSVFNMLALGLSDFFYLDGGLLGAIDPTFAFVGLLGLLLTNLALMGNLSRLERRVAFFELDALAIVVVYLLGMAVLFIQGIGG